VPTILHVQGYRLFFVSFDGSEPIHVHVRKGNRSAKVWVSSLSFAWSNFRLHENSAIRRIVEENAEMIREKWHEHFGY
jgi:hypothetical protein